MVGTEDRYAAGLGDPLLANVYLHYAFDLWVNVWRNKWAQGEVVVIRYADDTIVGFQYQADADRFLENLRERLAMFGLELHPDKTRRIEFGRFAEQNRKRRFAASERCNRSVDVTRRYHSLAERVMLVSRGR